MKSVEREQKADPAVKEDEEKEFKEVPIQFEVEPPKEAIQQPKQVTMRKEITVVEITNTWFDLLTYAILNLVQEDLSKPGL